MNRKFRSLEGGLGLAKRLRHQPVGGALRVGFRALPMSLLAAGELWSSRTGVRSFPGGQGATTTSGRGVTPASAATGATWNATQSMSQPLGATGSPNVFSSRTMYGASARQSLVPALPNARTVRFTFSNPAANPVAPITNLGITGTNGATRFTAGSATRCSVDQSNPATPAPLRDRQEAS